MLEHEFLERVFALPEHAGCVGQRKRDVPPVGRLLDLVPGGPGRFIHDGAPAPDNPVEQGRFPDIRAAHKDDGWERSMRHWSVLKPT